MGTLTDVHAEPAPPADALPDGYGASERLVRVEVGLGLLSQQVGGMQTALQRVEQSVSGRPSWVAASLLSISTMANGALLAAVVALIVPHGGK